MTRWDDVRWNMKSYDPSKRRQMSRTNQEKNRGGWLGSLEETHTDTRFNSLFSRKTWVRWYQKG